MAGDLNKVMLIGRLGADPEIRYTQNGTAVATLSVATNFRVKRGEEWEDQTEWHRVIAWNRLAEIASEYMSKGTKVYVEGRLQTRSWEDANGNKRWTTEIVARDISMLCGRGEAAGSGGGGDLAPPEPPPPEDDVPF